MTATRPTRSPNDYAPRSFGTRRTVSYLLLLGCLLSSSSNRATAFQQRHGGAHFAAIGRRRASKITTPTTSLTRCHYTPQHSPLEDEPWQDDGDSYWDALQAASKDPETFEKFIEESMARKKQLKGAPATTMASSSSASAAKRNGKNDGAAGGGEDGTAPKKKKKYVPIEEWDAQQRENMSAEERLQWECQRGGDRFRQNEILSRNLKSF